MLTKQDVREVIGVYIKAWTTQDPELITTIFTEDAIYWERVMQPITIGDREAIRAYWKDKVVGAQANITCELQTIYLDGDTAIAEWTAEFDDVAQGVRKRMKEIAVLDFDTVRPSERTGWMYRIKSLREYWASEPIEALATAERS